MVMETGERKGVLSEFRCYRTYIEEQELLGSTSEVKIVPDLFLPFARLQN